MPSDFFPYHTFIAMAWLSSPHQAITCFFLFLYHPLGVATEAALLLRRPSSVFGAAPMQHLHATRQRPDADTGTEL